MNRIAITVKLKEGSEARARDLVAAGPPFDPSRAGLTQHGVFVGPDFAVFVFEGEDVVQRLSLLLNDRLNSASFSRWAPLLAEQPRLAHEAYHWDPKEDTMKKILIATDRSNPRTRRSSSGSNSPRSKTLRRFWSTLPRPSRSCRTRASLPLPQRFTTSSANRTGCR